MPFDVKSSLTPSGEQIWLVTGGVILNIRDQQTGAIYDIEADRLVFWTRGESPLFGPNPQPQDSPSQRQLEFYLSGNVEIREQHNVPNKPPESRILRADEVYYDISRSVAIAVRADLEFKEPTMPDPVHFKADELLRLSPTQWQVLRGEVFSSKLASDPGFKIYFARATLEDKHVPKKNIFDVVVRNRRTGEPEIELQRRFRAEEVFFELEEVPVFYLPFLAGDAKDPLGPVRNIMLSYSKIFGGQFGVTLDGFDLLGIAPPPGEHWHITADYLTARGPALGTEFDYSGKQILGVHTLYTGQLKLNGMNDMGGDDLGGDRGIGDNHPDWRGRVFWQQNFRDLPDGFSVQTQVSAASDQNYLEQYFPLEYHHGINQENFLYVKQQQDYWAWTFLTQGRLENWLTQTQWLPRVDGYLIGLSPFNLLTYNAHADIGYARLRTGDSPNPPVDPTDKPINTGRFDFSNELSLPFYLGPFKLVPYVMGDLTYYTEDLDGTDVGRAYGALGLRASLPFTRIYPDAESTLFNVNGFNHKIELSANYYYAQASTPYSKLAQLDRLNDDATNFALVDIRPLEPLINPAHGTLLATSPIFDPQLYAIRRLVLNEVDTLADTDVLQLEINQRLQTHRGYPGQEHIVDWMTLTLSGSVFPQANRDNFGSNLAFLEYDWVWNIGDRTALVSSGWIEPIDNGPRVFTIGAYLNRPDRTNFFLGYRQIDPVQSKAVTAAVGYVFSPKYSITASSTYDFGTNQSLSNSLMLTRKGTDLQVSIGATYNDLQNSFGFLFQIEPNVLPQANRQPGVPFLGQGGLFH